MSARQARRLARFVGALALVATLASCAHVKGGSPEQTFSLNEGQRVGLNNGGSITFANVVNESRCPTGVQCVWAGTVTARFRLVSHSGGEAVDVLAVLPGGVSKDDAAGLLPVDTLGVTITLLELTPYPVAGQDPKSVTHRALVRVRTGGR
jgi:hypothetical protein